MGFEFIKINKNLLFLKMKVMKLPVKAGFFIISELKLSTDYLMHSETFNFQKNSKLTTFSFENSDLTVFEHFSKTHNASNN